MKLDGDEVVVADDADPDAAVIRPPDVIAALRASWGIDTLPIAERFPLGDSDLPLLPLFG